MRPFILCLLCLIPTIGCGSSPSPVIRIEVERPGTDAVTMDEQVAFPLIVAVRGAPHIADVQSQSFAGRTQIFVTSADSHSLEVVSKRVNDALTALPPDCRLIGIDRLKAGEKIPAPETGESEQVVINLKPSTL